MAVSLCVLKEELLGFRTEEYIKEGFNPSFTMCLTLPESGRLLPRCVYVGGLSSALNADRDDPDRWRGSPDPLWCAAVPYPAR